MFKFRPVLTSRLRSSRFWRLSTASTWRVSVYYTIDEDDWWTAYDPMHYRQTSIYKRIACESTVRNPNLKARACRTRKTLRSLPHRTLHTSKHFLEYKHPVRRTNVCVPQRRVSKICRLQRCGERCIRPGDNSTPRLHWRSADDKRTVRFEVGPGGAGEATLSSGRGCAELCAIECRNGLDWFADNVLRVRSNDRPNARPGDNTAYQRVVTVGGFIDGNASAIERRVRCAVQYQIDVQTHQYISTGIGRPKVPRDLRRKCEKAHTKQNFA